MTVNRAAACQPRDQRRDGASPGRVLGFPGLNGRSRPFAGPLRCISSLAPNLPNELLRLVGGYLAGSSRLPSVPVEHETPFPPKTHALAPGQAEVGFVCPTAFRRTYHATSGFDLPGCAPLFNHPPAEGRPVYHADAVVGRDAAVRSPEDLAGRAWAYNDSCSPSRPYSLLRFLHGHGRGPDFLGGPRPSGAHPRSHELVLSGAARIHSTVLAPRLQERAGLRSEPRIIAWRGPFPIQPLIVRRTLPEPVRPAMRQAPLGMSSARRRRARPAPFKLPGFGPVDDAFRAEERRQIEDCRAPLGARCHSAQT